MLVRAAFQADLTETGPWETRSSLTVLVGLQIVFVVDTSGSMVRAPVPACCAWCATLGFDDAPCCAVVYDVVYNVIPPEG